MANVAVAPRGRDFGLSVRSPHVTMQPMGQPDPSHLAEFLQIIDALNRHGVDYMVVGGFAVFLHGVPRFTADLDVFVRPDEENAGRLRTALRAVYPSDDVIDDLTLAEMREYAVLRYGTPSGFYVDIMAKLGEAVGFDDLRAIASTFEGVQVRLADPASLLKMKGDSVRPQDQADAVYLRELIRKQDRS